MYCLAFEGQNRVLRLNHKEMVKRGDRGNWVSNKGLIFDTSGRDFGFSTHPKKYASSLCVNTLYGTLRKGGKCSADPTCAVW